MDERVRFVGRLAAGEYRWVAQLLEHVVYAQPDNKDARNLQTDAFEQLAYQSEAATWRNFYTVGAKELRQGVPDIDIAVGTSPDLVKNIPLEMAFDYLGIALDVEKAEGKIIKINFEVDGTGDVHSLVLQNSVLSSRSKPVAGADVTLKASGAALNAVLMGGDPAGAIKAGNVSVTGKPEALEELLGMMTKFEFWFPIVTRPTA